MALTNEETLTRNDARMSCTAVWEVRWKRSIGGKFVAVAPDGRIMLGTNPYKCQI